MELCLGALWNVYDVRHREGVDPQRLAEFLQHTLVSEALDIDPYRAARRLDGVADLLKVGTPVLLELVASVADDTDHRFRSIFGNDELARRGAGRGTSSGRGGAAEKLEGLTGNIGRGPHQLATPVHQRLELVPVLACRFAHDPSSSRGRGVPRALASVCPSCRDSRVRSERVVPLRALT